MKLGVHIGYWGLGLTSEDQLRIVQEAERLGYDSVWAAEAYGSDTATVLAWLAGQTSKIRLGAGIFQMPGRSPAMTAMTATSKSSARGQCRDDVLRIRGFSVHIQRKRNSHSMIGRELEYLLHECGGGLMRLAIGWESRLGAEHG